MRCKKQCRTSFHKFAMSLFHVEKLLLDGLLCRRRNLAMVVDGQQVVAGVSQEEPEVMPSAVAIGNHHHAVTVLEVVAQQ